MLVCVLDSRDLDCHELLRNSRNDEIECNSCDSPHNDGLYALDSPRNDDNLPINNSIICGGSFVFLKIFRIEARLEVCEILKIFKSAKNAPKDELPIH